MFKSLRSSLYAIGLSAAVAIVAVAAFALWSFDSLGRSAAQAQASSAVVANVLPPPLYLIETRLLLSQAVEGSLPAPAAREMLQRLEQENRSELELWSSHGSEELRSLLAGEVAASSRAIFAKAARLLTAVEAGDLGRARQELDSVQRLYQAHRLAIDKTVAVGRKLESEAIADFERTRQGGIWALLAIASAFLFAAALSYARALRSVLIPVADCVALADRVADGDLHEPEAPDRSDELGTLQSALARMTVKLTAQREGLVRAREAAEQAGKAKADFLANMSHEIRTPMNAVLGLTHIVLRTSLSPKQREYLQKLQGSGQSLLRIINDVLDFSKIEAGKLELESAPFQLDRVFDELATALDPLLGGKSVELIVRRDDAVPNVLLGDTLRLKQVLLNLAANAVKFTPAGEVCIGAELVGREAASASIRFSVVDTGIGMSEAVQQQLFQAFTQADSSTTRNYGGTGLGLTISQRIVDLMGGEIQVQSAAGKGSQFSFTLTLPLPATELDWTRGPAERASAARHILKGLSALVVDDNYTARLTMVAMLRSFGLQVVEAASGSHALEVARASQQEGRRFAVALVDWRMPDLDGFAVIDALRDYESLSSASFIMVSAYDRDVVEAAMPQHAPEGLLQKPVTPSTLLDTLYGVIVKRAAADAEPERQALQPLPQLAGQVLLVEDNDINQLVAVELLSALGLEVKVADDAEQAIEQLRQHEFDAVIMDVQMPGMGGYEATGVIRELPGCRQLPIIAMTANSLPGEREKCLAAGMSDYLSKPIEPEVLAQCLQRWLGKKLVEA